LTATSSRTKGSGKTPWASPPRADDPKFGGGEGESEKNPPGHLHMVQDIYCAPISLNAPPLIKRKKKLSRWYQETRKDRVNLTSLGRQ